MAMLCEPPASRRQTTNAVSRMKAVHAISHVARSRIECLSAANEIFSSQEITQFTISAPAMRLKDAQPHWPAIKGRYNTGLSR
jgi:hypothetical protein